MNKIIEFINQNKFGNLATCSNEKPDTRPFELVFHDDKGMFFYSSAEEELTNQLKQNPNICFCATDSNYNYVKVKGSIEFSENKDDKIKILEKSKFAKNIFSDSNIDKMKVFSLPHGKCMLHMHNDDNVIIEEF
ncbi:putative pyridoxamine 5'-phosphate oxidase family protein [Sedimentibacter acidaminivorans]|uniref:Pyridoxamine 5'-phosphate oxidase family protein n=1 Tax=Sedimentibacter acidaminivorans TaxID=913099 RepID=A0ABS4GC62_9FIRM|nr:pyridoxamine 5'-phosphate oxidase family protein [Sedimentibacter acidaminivorans]MBP1925283.1 putative pyridoxamine 5'-phosphate oxidase family protein [Sedimentibacter acidaminivorans]